ncbi:MAG TPA: aldo/keto reductase, partial [Thermoanaerobaculia bacterium]|nr:aldo/keto reductase [Thermoanaerobaculia bacterium]
DAYSLGRSEEIVGKALRELTSRDRVVIATKVFFKMTDDPNSGGLSRKHILDAVDASLRRLGTDYIDLYQIHRFDPQTPIEETLEALDALVRSGKVRYVGASSMWAWQLARMLAASDARGLARFATMQNHYNLAYREEEREMIPLCAAEGVGLLPWSPLARGLLTGSRKRGEAAPTARAKDDAYARELYEDADFDVVDRLVEVARKKGEPPARVALAWLLSRPGVVAPIVGATKLAHLEDAIAALDVQLSPEEIASLEEPYRPHAVRGHA